MGNSLNSFFSLNGPYAAPGNGPPVHQLANKIRGKCREKTVLVLGMDHAPDMTTRFDALMLDNLAKALVAFYSDAVPVNRRNRRYTAREFSLGSQLLLSAHFPGSSALFQQARIPCHTSLFDRRLLVASSLQTSGGVSPYSFSSSDLRIQAVAASAALDSLKIVDLPLATVNRRFEKGEFQGLDGLAFVVENTWTLEPNPLRAEKTMIQAKKDFWDMLERVKKLMTALLTWSNHGESWGWDKPCRVVLFVNESNPDNRDSDNQGNNQAISERVRRKMLGQIADYFGIRRSDIQRKSRRKEAQEDDDDDDDEDDEGVKVDRRIQLTRQADVKLAANNKTAASDNKTSENLQECCLICYAQPVDTTLYPCQHRHLCWECAHMRARDPAQSSDIQEVEDGASGYCSSSASQQHLPRFSSRPLHVQSCPVCRSKIHSRKSDWERAAADSIRTKMVEDEERRTAPERRRRAARLAAKGINVEEDLYLGCFQIRVVGCRVGGEQEKECAWPDGVVDVDDVDDVSPSDDASGLDERCIEGWEWLVDGL